MFWFLVLAHLSADYPLQTDRMVLAKKHLPGLLMHVGVHLLVMMALFIPVLGLAWPFLLIVAICHFLIDAFKNFLSNRRPQWVVGPYVLDQVLHFASMIWVMSLMDTYTDLPVWPVISPWPVYLSGLLVATYIWFISERIIMYKDESRQIAVNSTMWPRMGTRMLLYILVVAPLSFTPFLALLVGVLMFILYRRYNYLSTWLIIDISVPVLAALIVRAILSFW